LTRLVLSRWRDLGFTAEQAAERCVITPTCGLAGATWPWVRTALSLATTVAANVATGD
jgi:hypothetical protein